MSSRSRLLSGAVLVLVAGCAGPPATAHAVLGGQEPGLIELGEVNLWALPITLVLEGTIVIPPNEAPTLDLVIDGSRPIPIGRPLMAMPGPVRSDSFSALVQVPVVPVGPRELEVVLRLDGAEVGRWVVRRTIIDPEVTLCGADLPAEVEDETAPLTKCLTPSPAQVELSNVGIDGLSLPYEGTGARVKRRLSVSVKRGSVTATAFVIAFPPPLPPEQTVTPEAPVVLTFEETLLTRVKIGGQPLEPKPASAKRTLVDRNPTPEFLAVRLGRSFEVVHDVSVSAQPVELIAVEGSAGLSALDQLPLRLTKDAQTGLHLRYAPTTLGGTEAIATLRLRDAAGVIHTDRLSLPMRPLPRASCELAIDEVFVGPISLGDSKTVRFDVRNTGNDGCFAARFELKNAAEVELLSSPFPVATETSTWSLRYTAQSVGPQVRLLSIFFDAERPTEPDLVVRINANPTK